MSLIYFNQNNYSYVPYPSDELPSATVASGGCGVTCGAMIVSNLTSTTIDPEAMAQYSINHGARVSGGTNMDILATALCSDYGMTYTTTTDENELLQHLASGGMAVANVGGDRSGYTGVFSNGGHFIVVAGCDGSWLTILDPGYYSGKFNKSGRSGKVEIDGNICYCDISVLGADTSNRNPSYWLFNSVERVIDLALETWQREGGQKALQELASKGLVSNIENWNSETELAKNIPAYLFWMIMNRLADYAKSN